MESLAMSQGGSSAVARLAEAVRRNFAGRFDGGRIDSLADAIVGEAIDRDVLRSMTEADLGSVFPRVPWGMRRALHTLGQGCCPRPESAGEEPSEPEAKSTGDASEAASAAVVSPRESPIEEDPQESPVSTHGGRIKVEGRRGDSDIRNEAADQVKPDRTTSSGRDASDSDVATVDGKENDNEDEVIDLLSSDDEGGTSSTAARHDRSSAVSRTTDTTTGGRALGQSSPQSGGVDDGLDNSDEEEPSSSGIAIYTGRRRRNRNRGRGRGRRAPRGSGGGKTRNDNAGEALPRSKPKAAANMNAEGGIAATRPSASIPATASVSSVSAANDVSVVAADDANGVKIPPVDAGLKALLIRDAKARMRNISGTPVMFGDDWRNVWEKMRYTGWEQKVCKGVDTWHYYLPGGIPSKEGGQPGIDFLTDLDEVFDFAKDHLGWSGEQRGILDENERQQGTGSPPKESEPKATTTGNASGAADSPQDFFMGLPNKSFIKSESGGDGDSDKSAARVISDRTARSGRDASVATDANKKKTENEVIDLLSSDDEDENGDTAASTVSRITDATRGAARCYKGRRGKQPARKSEESPEAHNDFMEIDSSEEDSIEGPPTEQAASEDEDMYVGFVGSSGTGKSTALVSLLNGCDILPRSSMQACTSSVIELRYRRWEEKEEELVSAVDALFVAYDTKDSVAPEDFVQSLEVQFGTKLCGSSRKKVLDRLADLSTGKEIPIFAGRSDEGSYDGNGKGEIYEPARRIAEAKACFRDDKYLAEIEFMSQNEWDVCLEDAIAHSAALRDQIDSAEGDSTKIHQALEDAECLDQGDEPNRLASVHRILAVYGQLYSSIEEYEQAAPACLKDLIGTTTTYTSSTPSKVQQMVGKYLATGKDRGSPSTSSSSSSSSSSAQTQVWALVKCARIHGPWLMLSSGLVLVDLPGLADADAARNSVVDSYVDKCKGLVLVAPVHRATDDKVTRDFVTDRLRQRLCDGQVKFLALLATKTDTVREREIVEELGEEFERLYQNQMRVFGLEDMSEGTKGSSLLKVVSSLQESLKQVMTQKRVLADELHDLDNDIIGLGNDHCFQSKRNTKESAMEMRRTMLADAEKNEEKFQHDLLEKQKLLRHMCINARTAFVTHQAKVTLQRELQGLVPLDSGGRGLQLTSWAVCNTEYLQAATDGGSQLFYDPKETGVPAFLDWLWKTSNCPEDIVKLGKLQTSRELSIEHEGEDNSRDNAEANVDEWLAGLLTEQQEETDNLSDADLAIQLEEEQKEQERAAAQARATGLNGAEMVLQSRTSYLKEIIARNELLAKSIQSLLQLSTERLAPSRRLNMWRQRVRQLEEGVSAKCKPAMLGILGDTGAGKSSLLNAVLCDNDDVLPTSGVRACTAAPIEIRPSSESSKFCVEVVFLTEEEWRAEVRTLLDDLRDEGGELNTRMERPSGETAKIAYDKIKSVYGQMGEWDELECTGRYLDPVRRLGTTRRLEDATAAGIRSKAEQFASSRTAVSDQKYLVVERENLGRYWPLVKRVEMKGPFSILQGCSGVLVDLPGLMDANAARNRVVIDYIQECSGFLIAAPITRAVDNKTAKNLLGRQFRRQMLLDGQLGSIAFVATQTDVINAFEVWRELGVDRLAELTEDTLHLSTEELRKLWGTHAPKIRKLRKDIAAITKNEQKLRARKAKDEKSISKLKLEVLRTREHDYQLRRELRNEISRFSKLVDELKQQLESAAVPKSKKQLKMKKHEHVLNRVCSLARNSYAQTHLKQDFKAGIDDLSNSMMSSQSSSASTSLSDSLADLPVFTVSSRDFHDLAKLGPTGATTWYTANDTGIPRLRQFVRSTLERNRMNSESMRARELVLFLESMTQYLRIKKFPSATERVELTIVGNEEMAKLQRCCDDKTSFLMDQMRKILVAEDGRFAKSLRKGQTSAEAAALKQIEREEGRVHWATYRATVKRHGEYASPTAGPVNLNEALARPVLDGAAMEWSGVFGKGITEFTNRWVQAMEQIARKSLARLSKALEGKVSSGSTLVAPLRGEMGHVALKGFSLHLKELVQEFEEKITKVQRDASRSIQQHVKKSMHNGYERGRAEHGPGCVARLKQHVRKSADIERHRMFRAALSELLSHGAETDKNGPQRSQTSMPRSVARRCSSLGVVM